MIGPRCGCTGWKTRWRAGRFLPTWATWVPVGWCRIGNRKGGQAVGGFPRVQPVPFVGARPVEWVFAALKQWRCLRRFRPCPRKVGMFAAAIGLLTWWGW